MTHSNQTVSNQQIETTNTVFNIETRLDLSYITTLPGILKLIVIILNLIVYICIQSSYFWSNGPGIYLSLVAHLGFWFSTLLLFFYIYHIIEKYHNIKWLKIEMVGCVVLVFLNVIASSMAVGYGSPNFSAAGFFGYLTMVTYGFDVYLKARALKTGELPQGHRVRTDKSQVAAPSRAVP